MSDIQGPFSSLIEDYTSVSTTTVIPAGQHRWYSNIPGAPTGAYTLLVGDGTSDLTELPRNLYNNSMAALENPVYGEPLEAGELFLDGTDSFISSDGREPVVDVVDFEPAKINVDGSEVDNDVVKWPGQRGANGFFGEYENLIPANISIVTNATISTEGAWTKLTAVANGNSQMYATFSALSTVGIVYYLVRQGNTTISSMAIGSGRGGVTITWGVSIVMDTGSVDIKSSFLTPEIALVMVNSSAIGSTALYLRAGDAASGLAGDYTYYKDWMVVDLPYPVPYTKGTHPASKLQYDFDWATSDEWTIEGWFKVEVSGDAKIIVYPRDSPFTEGWWLQVSDADNLVIVSERADGGNQSTVGATALSLDTWYHAKTVFEQNSQIRVYLNGSLEITHTSGIPDSVAMNKIIYYGISSSGASPLCGYMADWTIQPGIDTSTTHYTSGLPYYNPEKTYGQDASWSIDKRGNVSGLFQQAGNIVEDYELDGQRVTKWDSGLMEISQETHGAGVVNPLAITYVTTFTNIPTVSTQVDNSSGNRSSSITTKSVNGCECNRYTADTGVSATNSISWSAIGRWK